MQKPIDFIKFRNRFFKARYRWKWTRFKAKRISEVEGISLYTAIRWEKRFKRITKE